VRSGERAVAAAIVVQLLVAVPATVTLGPQHQQRRDVTVSRADAVRATDTSRTQAIRALLGRRARAVMKRDKKTFLADLDPTQHAFVAQQAAVFDRLTVLRFNGWRYELDPDRQRAHTPSLDALRGTWWSPNVVLRYSLAGYDRTPTEEPQGLTFVQRGSRWYLAADADFARTGHPTQRDMWDVGAVRVTTGPSCLVLSHPAGAGMAALALTECEAAVPRVTAVWGARSSWSCPTPPPSSSGWSPTSATSPTSQRSPRPS
jgi:hypothetical protein